VAGERASAGRRHGDWCYNALVAMFYVVVRRTGPEWDPARALHEQSGWDAHARFMDDLVATGFVVLGGPLADERRVVLAVAAESEAEVRQTLARDPWSETHLIVGSIDQWAIRLDGREPAGASGPPAAGAGGVTDL
jgi:hypothetical protein